MHRPDPALRVAFVGRRTFFEACSLLGSHRGLRGTFVDFAPGGEAGALRAQLEDLSPHFVVAFEAEAIPAGTFGGLRATTLGYVAEPMPHGPGSSREDRERRVMGLREVDVGNFDRVAALDPRIAAMREPVLAIWRTFPLPVADRYYADVRPITPRPRLLFVGRSNPHRDATLAPVEREYGLTRLDLGVDADELEVALREHEVGVNVHAGRSTSFENPVLLHLAAGHLLFSQALNPLHGLEPGIDFVQFFHHGHLLWACDRLIRFPTLHDRIRIRGRLKVEQYRASRVWPRLIGDAFADITAFGSARRRRSVAERQPVDDVA